MSNPNIAPAPQTPETSHNAAALSIAYHGVIARIANMRVNAAGRTMERMEHKEALYSDLGQIATGGVRVAYMEHERRRAADPAAASWLEGKEFVAALTAPGRGRNHPSAMPRTMVEKHMDRRIAKQSRKIKKAEYYASRDSAIYGGVSSITDPYLRERLGNRTVDRNDPRAVPKFNLDDRIVERLYGPSSLRGVNKNERKDQAMGVYKQEGLLAAERRQAKLEAKAQPVKRGSESVRKSSKKLHKETAKFRHSTDHIFMSHWREMRHERAIGRIQKHHRTAQEHRDIQEQLRAQRR